MVMIIKRWLQRFADVAWTHMESTSFFKSLIKNTLKKKHNSLKKTHCSAFGNEKISLALESQHLYLMNPHLCSPFLTTNSHSNRAQLRA